jgi:hypothetical protein
MAPAAPYSLDPNTFSIPSSSAFERGVEAIDVPQPKSRPPSRSLRLRRPHAASLTTSPRCAEALVLTSRDRRLVSRAATKIILSSLTIQRFT